jgi:hypothetical protein
MRIGCVIFLGLLSTVAVADAPAFPEYPQARLLCSEHVSGNSMHITWRTHASTDDVAKVVAFYEKASKTKAGTGDKKERTFRDGDRHLSIYAATDNDKFPKCATKPKAGEKTVILYSSAAR